MVNHTNKIKEFFNNIGITINDADLFTEAFSHKSYNEEIYYQRLEFFGDSILSFLTSEYLFSENSLLSEGELSLQKISIVSKEALVNVYNALNFNDFIYINRKSFENETPESIKADIIESTLAAVYLDSGMKAARIYFDLILKHTGKMPEYFFARNEFQEKILRLYKILPEFRITNTENGFSCSIYIKDEFIAQAEANNKKECEKKAANEALNTFKRRLNEDNCLH